MPYLLAQIFLCLLLAFLIGLLIGWWIWSRRCRNRIEDLENELSRLRASLKDCESEKSAALAAGAAGAAVGAAVGGASGGIRGIAAMAAGADPDDLKKIWGIGPKMEQLLNGAGIYTFAQVRDTTVDTLRNIVEAYGSKKLTDIANEEVWPEQAEIAARGAFDELKAYQAKLSWRDGGGKPTS